MPRPFGEHTASAELGNSVCQNFLLLRRDRRLACSRYPQLTRDVGLLSISHCLGLLAHGFTRPIQVVPPVLQHSTVDS